MVLKGQEGSSESSPRYKEKETRAQHGFPAFWKNLVKKMAIEEVDYKPMRRYPEDGNPKVTWYFDFYLLNPNTNEMERVKRTFDINRIKDIATRTTVADKLVEKFNKALKDGKVNYAMFFNVPDSQKLSALIPILLEEYLKRAAKVRKESKNGQKRQELSQRTKDTYRLYISRLTKFLEKRGLSDSAITVINDEVAQEFQDYLIEELELSNTSINETIGLNRSLWHQARRKKFVVSNPFDDIQSLPVSKSSKYVPYSNDEKKLIASSLRLKSPMLYLASQVLYSCFVRPQEICCLYRRDIDFSNSTILVREEAAKNNTTSFREIPKALLMLMRDMGIDRLSPNALIFEEICGSNPRPDLRRKRVTELWRKLVIDELGIKNAFYALKHTGNCDYILNNPNYDIMWLMQQNGHHSLDMTQKYIKDLPIIKLQKSGAQVSLYGEGA